MDPRPADPSWTEQLKRLRCIAPYLWPSKSANLQIVATLCVLLGVVGRFVNLLTPLMLAEVVRSLSEVSTQMPWPYLLAYVGLCLLQGSGGLSALREVKHLQMLWAPVLQYSYREMSHLTLTHLLNLSLAFHTRRKMGDILCILDRGSVINRTFELLLFNIIPTLVDIFVALVFFCVFFEWTLTLVIAFVLVAYIMASVIINHRGTQLQRAMIEHDAIARGIYTDCLLNYETVKCFNGEKHEADRYDSAIRQYQAVEYKVASSLNFLLNLVQNLIITMGLLMGCIIVALRVSRGELRPDQFVFFVTYISQLYGPLNLLGYMHRFVNQSLVDAENLLKLLNQQTEVNDKANALELVLENAENAEIEFKNVSFSYNSEVATLKDISFKVPRGSSVALVGKTGSGKSTVLRLLCRFYDLKEGQGQILIDGKDIRDVTQSSLRNAIGVVPQDCILFNASIAYNIGYGKFGASQEEIEAAAKAVQIHDRILNFPDGYATTVGELGVRLSGGERQRIAIARALLHNPPIMLLDEATSALDTQTERDIQEALSDLMRGHSSLLVAHRLSVSFQCVDSILVLEKGEIVEQGSHAELLARNGVFATMWMDQVVYEENRSGTK
ncbi:P-loop containing nucleoside triphosphate hydrolase protein [Obba rivulosa]|uniref:P-loop containing nucleoside triphosphate hydrolase protein n=1 Tax=Obba rivulosa TaxID=1052685 RepID=A0A8E2AGJ2_9APHY|nr:P-loop containing nucleoside triphosphate hydrolase protein [Obba rivulosa]